MDETNLDDSIYSTPTTTTARSTSPLNQANDASTEYVDRNVDSSDESRRNSLTYEITVQDFDQMTLSAAKALNSKLTDLDDGFTFKRKNLTRPSGSRIFSRADSPMKMRSNYEIGHISTSQRRHNDEEFDGDVADWSIEGTGRRVAYDDFTTIDWIHDFAKERTRRRRLKKQGGLIGKLRLIFDEMEGWIVVFTVGIASGILAGIIDITSDWLSDLKEGYCNTAFYLSRKNCCWGYDGIVLLMKPEYGLSCKVIERKVLDKLLILHNFFCKLFLQWMVAFDSI
ncbi:37_t:CDS:2 [Acaulospora colombiana]|uniref:37_t:CDS:1 n=1 Tax=Acaulospora colombiana TaxID=27376 RepID=A0ACA9L417_9GLOM|nr:37_t:CDS:2 [Acaulospora colombiana]